MTGEDRDARVSDSELDQIERTALEAKDSRNLSLVPFISPELVVRLVRSHRRASKEALQNHLEWSDTADVNEDLAQNIVDVRDALRAIATVQQDDPQRACHRMRAIARKALKAEEIGDRSMRMEFGYAVENVARDEMPEDEESMDIPFPNPGETWEDGLGGRYLIVEADEDSDAVRVEVLQPIPEWIQVEDLFVSGRRISIETDRS